MASEDEAENLEQNAFYYFVKDLRVLSQNAAAQCEEMESYNTPREIRADVKSGAFLADSHRLQLTQSQRDGIRKIVSALDLLPNEAIDPKGIVLTTYAGCVAGMSHQAWEPLRREAISLLALLEPAIERNRKYLYPD